MNIKQLSLKTSSGEIPLLLLPVQGKETVSVRIIVQSGSFDETESEYGIAHFLEHMAFKGTEKYSCEEINRLVASVGDPNAYTTFDRTVYYIDTIPEFIDKAAELLVEMFFHSTFPKEELEKERGVILQEWQACQDSPNNYYFSNATNKVLGAPFHPIIGTDKHIKAHTQETIKAFRNRTYTLDKITVAIVGHIPTSTVNKTVAHLRKLFKNEAKGYKTNLPCAPVNCFNKPYEDTVLKHASVQSWLGLWWNWYDAEHLQKTFRTSDIFENVLGDGLHSLMTVELREKLGLCYASGSMSYELWNNNMFIVYSMLSKENIPAAQAAMIKVLTKVRDDGVDPKLLNIAKANYLIKTTSSYDRLNKYTYYVDTWMEAKEFLGNSIHTVDDAKLSCKKCTQKVIKDYADYLLNNTYHVITMEQNA